MNLEGKRVTLHDMSLRDGMHPQRHQLTPEQMIEVATALDEAAVPLIEVTHGDGLGGASVNYGFPAATDEEYLRAVVRGSARSTSCEWRTTAACRRFEWRRIALRRTSRSSTLVSAPR